jgi:AraC-like DNA-binding protein
MGDASTAEDLARHIGLFEDAIGLRDLSCGERRWANFSKRRREEYAADEHRAALARKETAARVSQQLRELAPLLHQVIEEHQRSRYLDNKHKNIDWDAQPLGKMSDPELARRLGCSPSSVAKQRKKRGIELTYLEQTGSRDA